MAANVTETGAEDLFLETDQADGGIGTTQSNDANFGSTI